MVRAALTAAFADLWAAITTLHLYYFLNLQPGQGWGTTTTTSPQASAFVGNFQIFLTLVAAGGLYAAVALIYRHLHQAEAAAAAGGGNRRLPDLVTFILFAAVGILNYVLFVQRAGGAVDVGALGLAAARVLPAASTGTFFLGMVLIILVHVRAGGEGGGGSIAGDGPIHALVWLQALTNMAFAAAGALICLTTIALYTAKY